MDTQIATQTRTSESRMGTVDTLLGLIAAVAVDPRGRLIPVGDFYNILHKLQTDALRTTCDTSILRLSATTSTQKR